MEKEKIFKQYFSEPRLAPYYTACNNSVDKALELYQLNMRLGASFMPLLSLLEVTLRNAIDNQLRVFFSKADWWEELENLLEKESQTKIKTLTGKYGQPPAGFTDKEPLWQTYKHMRKIKNDIEREFKNEVRNDIKIHLRKSESFKAKNEFEQLTEIENLLKSKLAAKPITITHSKLISSANFGFWASLFKTEIYHVLKGTLIHATPYRSLSVKADDICFMLDEIRKLRNRVAHHEPLCFKDRKFDLENVKNVHGYAETMLAMINSHLLDFSHETFIVHQSIRDVNDFIENLPYIVGYKE